jgi:hypothetical protein
MFIVPRTVFAAAVIAIVVGLQAHADVLVDQPLTASPSTQFGYNSNGPNSGAGTNAQQIADVFNLATAATANQVSWYGTYFDGSVVTNPVSFLVRFYSDVSGPGVLLSEQFISVTATDTGLQNDAGLEILSYNASLSNVSLTAGNSWISISENDPTIPVIWTWQFSDVGQNNVASRQGDTQAYTTGFQNNMAFTLSGSAVPEPSSIILSCVGVASLGLWKRRRAKS